jgi:hypothetical protein
MAYGMPIESWALGILGVVVLISNWPERRG